MFDRIAESARTRLHSSSYSAVRSIGCSCHEGVLTLRGCLPSYYQKQLALALVGNLEGVRAIADQIRVIPGHSREGVMEDGFTRGDR